MICAAFSDAHQQEDDGMQEVSANDQGLPQIKIVVNAESVPSINPSIAKNRLTLTLNFRDSLDQ